MITTNIKYGGALKIGDFIGVGSNWGMDFGWYSGNGKSGTVQFITPQTITYDFTAYTKRQQGGYPEPKDRRGFSLDCISKSFVRVQHGNRIVKITCPDDVFTGKELQQYLEAKRILTDMKFLKP